MIIFYDNKTGEIIGTIEGRIHTEDHLKMWIGEKDKTGRLVCNWIVVKEYKDKSGVIISSDYEPENNKEIIYSIDKAKSNIRDYKVDLITGNLTLKQK